MQYKLVFDENKTPQQIAEGLKKLCGDKIFADSKPTATVDITIKDKSGTPIYSASKTVELSGKFSVNYDLDGGSIETANYSCYYIPTVSETEYDLTNSPTKAGYTFTGWYRGNTKLEKLPGEVLGNLSIKAGWDIITYNITYDSDGGVNDASNPATYTVETDTITLQDPTKGDYHIQFLGWYQGSTKVTEIAKGTTGNISLKAKWHTHTFSNGVCTDESCKMCELVAKNGSHTFDQNIVTDDARKSEASCTQKAKYYKSCKCGAISENDEEVFTDGDALGHIYKFVSKTKHECTREGCDLQEGHTYVKGVCACGYKEACSLGNHNIQSETYLKAEEYHSRDCADCGETVKENHNFTNYKYNNDAGCTTDGTKTGTCVCGKTDVIDDSTHPATGHKDMDHNGLCDSCNEKLAYIVAQYLYTETGASVPKEMGNVLAYYTENEDKTLEAPIVTGYNFVGWYAYDSSVENTKHYKGENLCTSRTYKITVTKDTDLVAVYKPLASVEVTIDGGNNYSINGETKAEKDVSNYPLGSKLTVVCNNTDFEYWKNSAGMVLSRNKTYTFTVTGKESVTAVLNTVVANKATVVFESYYGQVMARNQYASGDSLVSEPGLPYRYGYKALGWDYNGDGEYDAETDTFAKALDRAFNAAGKIVKISPVYELIVETYTITVENGSGGGDYNLNDKVTVTANEPEQGKKFSHWMDAEGKILSYNKTYQFFVSKTMTVTAVYVNVADKVDAKGTTAIIETIKDSEGGKLIFVSMSTVPSGCTINKAGIIATNDSGVGTSGAGFNESTATYVRGDAWTGDAFRYTWTKGNVSTGDTWYVRAYLVYTDAEGNTHTVYGDMVSLTM